MHSMTSEDTKEQKAACDRKKSPAYAGKKTMTINASLALPKGRVQYKHS